MITVGQTLPDATLYEFIDTETEGCTLGPNAFSVSKLVAGKKIVILAERETSWVTNPTSEESVKKAPNTATIWRRLISPPPILQLPAWYWLIRN